MVGQIGCTLGPIGSTPQYAPSFEWGDTEADNSGTSAKATRTVYVQAGTSAAFGEAVCEDKVRESIDKLKEDMATTKFVQTQLETSEAATITDEVEVLTRVQADIRRLKVEYSTLQKTQVY